MVSALKNIQSNSNSYNLVNQYNSLTDGLSKHRYRNFVKNSDVCMVVKNDDKYDISLLGDDDLIDETKFSIPFWYHTDNGKNTTGIGLNLNKTSLRHTRKNELVNLRSIPIILDTSHQIQQEIDVELRYQTRYVVGVEYQITRVTQSTTIPVFSVEPVTNKNLTIDLKVWDDSSFSTMSNKSFVVNNTDYKITNSSNYTYTKYFTFKNLNKFDGNTNFKLTLGGSVTDNNLAIIVKSAKIYEGNVAIPGITKESDINDFLNFDNKIWRISNNGRDFFSLTNNNLITVGVNGQFTNLDEAIDASGENVLFFFISDVNLNTNKDLRRGCSILGNGFYLNVNSSSYLKIDSSSYFSSSYRDNTNTNELINIVINGGVYSLKIEKASNVTLNNVIFKDIASPDGSMLSIHNSKNITGIGLVFLNSNSKSNKCIEIANTCNCDLSINTIENYGYISGTDITGVGVFLQNITNSRIFVNNIEAQYSTNILTKDLTAVQEVNSDKNIITILNHKANYNTTGVLDDLEDSGDVAN
jgi:hypothetical protein